MTHRILYEIANSNTQCSHGAIEIDGAEFFFKRLDPVSRKRELNGYEQVASHFPTARFEGTFMDGDDELVLYEFLHATRLPGGMLSDILDDTYDGDISDTSIIEMYRKSYASTLEATVCHAQDVFFADRIDSRIARFYSDDFIQEWTGRRVTVNGTPVTVNLEGMLASLRNFFAQSRPEPSVISQGDPTEYNIGTRPVLLDYDAGGRVPLAADVAVVAATTLHFGDYLARTYNPGYYERRGLTQTNPPVGTANAIVRKVSKRRLRFVHDFAAMADTVMSAPLRPEDAQAYACYFTMKLLAVFDISKLPATEAAYVLATAQHVFDNVENCSDFVSLVKGSAL